MGLADFSMRATFYKEDAFENPNSTEGEKSRNVENKCVTRQAGNEANKSLLYKEGTLEELKIDLNKVTLDCQKAFLYPQETQHIFFR